MWDPTHLRQKRNSSGCVHNWEPWLIKSGSPNVKGIRNWLGSNFIVHAIEGSADKSDIVCVTSCYVISSTNSTLECIYLFIYLLVYFINSIKGYNIHTEHNHNICTRRINIYINQILIIAYVYICFAWGYISNILHYYISVCNVMLCNVNVILLCNVMNCYYLFRLPEDINSSHLAHTWETKFCRILFIILDLFLHIYLYFCSFCDSQCVVFKYCLKRVILNYLSTLYRLEFILSSFIGDFTYFFTIVNVCDNIFCIIFIVGKYRT